MDDLNLKELAIKDIVIKPVDLGLINDFTISRGSISVAENIFVCVKINSGIKGYGEIAPFEGLTGEKREKSLHIAEKFRSALTGKSVSNFYHLSKLLYEIAPDHPSTRCGFETAIIDAYARYLNVPFWALFGGKVINNLKTDITIPISDINQSMELAENWYKKGFETLKLKVGKNPENEIHLVEKIFKKLPDVKFIFDANQGFSKSEAVQFIKELIKLKCKVEMIEQPVERDDTDGLKELRHAFHIPIAADESVLSKKDAIDLVKKDAVDIINLKIMKSGVIETFEIASIAKAAGLELMIGGMVESRLGMSCSLGIVLSRGDIKYLDLDTPLLLKEDHHEGGYEYHSALIKPYTGNGLALTPKIFMRE